MLLREYIEARDTIISTTVYAVLRSKGISDVESDAIIEEALNLVRQTLDSITPDALNTALDTIEILK
jgi:hypothetical protein